MQQPYSRTLFELLDEQATRNPDGLAVICEGRRFTYAGLAQAARQSAGALRTMGVGRGDRVGLLINNRIEWLEIAFGAWLLGAVAVPFSTWSTRAELDFLIGDAAISVLITLPNFAREDYAAILRDIAPNHALLRHVLMLDAWAALRDAAPRLDTPAPGDGAGASDDAIILYTSGSTSRPKAIPLAHYLIVENGFNIGERQGLRADDRVHLSPPLFWTYGGVNALPATFTHGAALVLQGRFDAGQALDLIEAHACTSIYTLPSMTSAMVRHAAFSPERTRSLRTGMTIGSPQDVRMAVEVLGAAELCNIFGASETGGNCCVTHHSWPLERRANCQGLPLPGVRLRIADEDGAPVPQGQPGQVEVSGPYVMRGYTCGSAQHNASSFTADGWFRSGDIGSLDADGAFVFQGRSTEMIKRAGINVSPAEVEDVLLQHPGVAQAGVIGVPSDAGESIVAFVVAANAANAPTPEQLAAHCRTIASSYKVPDRFEIVASLPTTVTGKLMRRELKALALAAIPVA